MHKLLLALIIFPSLSYAGDFGIGMHAGLAKNSIQGNGSINNGLSAALDLNYNTKRIYTGLRAEGISIGNGIAFIAYCNYKIDPIKKLHPYAGIAAGYSILKAHPLSLKNLTTQGSGFCSGIQGGTMYYIKPNICLLGEAGLRIGKLNFNDAASTTFIANTNRTYSTVHLRFGINFMLPTK